MFNRTFIVRDPGVHSHNRDESSIPALTGIRFFPAFTVLLMHASHPASALGRFLARSGAATNLVHTGYAGVSFFFVLSGFVLTMTYGRKELNLRQYLTARFARVYPVYFLGLVLAFPFVLVSAIHAVAATGAAPAVFGLATGAVLTTSLLQAWFPRWALAWNAPAWSLSVEAFFYLLFPLALTLSRRISSRTLYWTAAALWLVSQLPMLVAHYVPALTEIARADAAHPSETSVGSNLLKFNPLLRLPEFLEGILAGQCYLRRKASQWDDDSSLIVICILALGGLAAFLSPWIPFLFFHNGGLAPLFAFLVYRLAVSRSDLVRFLFGSRVLVALGRASYITYILQVPVLGWLSLLDGKTLHLERSIPIPFVFAQLVFLLGLSVCLHGWIEEPARKRIHSWLSRHSYCLPDRSAPVVQTHN